MHQQSSRYTPRQQLPNDKCLFPTSVMHFPLIDWLQVSGSDSSSAVVLIVCY
jgi:hypothetical protein